MQPLITISQNTSVSSRNATITVPSYSSTFGRPTESNYSVKLVTVGSNKFHFIIGQTTASQYIDSLEDASEAMLAMLASEDILAKYWDTPEEDEAWQHLQDL